MNILVDLGNSRLKWGIGQGRDIRCGEPLAHRDSAFAQRLEDAWRSLDETPRRLALASVAAPELLQQVCQIALRLWPQIEIVRARSQSRAFGVQNAYRTPEKLGVDRWLCLLAARRYHPLPACIADCGTAVTVDVIDAQGLHRGGVIAPGLHLMKQALHRGAQDIPYSARHYPPGLAADTEAAMHSGAVYACIGLIERIMREQREPPHLLLTGGDAGLIAAHLAYKSEMAADLVLQGLSVLLENGA
jgi:type III pantothenate kinase